MAHAHHAPAEVPSDMVTHHRDGWIAFTHFVKVGCIAVAGLLVFLLLIFKVF